MEQWRRVNTRFFSFFLSLRRRRNAKREGSVRLGRFTVRYTDAVSLSLQYKDIFRHRIYHFQTNTDEPLIIDGGSCIGVSTLYFKSVYPKSKVICFEPDQSLFQILQWNITANKLDHVELIRAGLAGELGNAGFQPDGSDGGRIVHGETTGTIPVVRLSDYLTKPVDFLKLNIEGQELEVLREVEEADKLRHISEMVVEYHGWPEKAQDLGAILTILDRQGFRYLVHDFDGKTNPATKPPFTIRSNTRWYCLIYAKRYDT
jgi:FkbM family methyltransferase